MNTTANKSMGIKSGGGSGAGEPSNSESSTSYSENASSKNSAVQSNTTSSSEKSKLHFDRKPNYLVKETNKEGVKYYYCVLYFPNSCKDVIKKVNP